MSESASSHCSASSYYSSSRRGRDSREVSARSGGSGHAPTTSTAATSPTSAASASEEWPGSPEEWPEVAPKKDPLDKQLPKAKPAPKIDGQDKYTRKRPLAAGQEKAHKKQRVEEPMAQTEGVSPFETIRKNVWGGKDHMLGGMSDDEFALLEKMMAEDKTDPLLFSPFSPPEAEAEDVVNVKVSPKHVDLLNQFIQGMHTPLSEFTAGSSSGRVVKRSMIMPFFGRCMYEIHRRLRQAVVMFGAAMQSKRYYDGLAKDMEAVFTERDTLRKDKKALQEKVTDLEKEKANADKLREEIVRLKHEKAKLSKEKVAAKSHLRAALAQLDA